MPPPMIGTVVGSYRITHKIGEGGMGVVYQAEHSIMGRKAAVKVLLAEWSRDQHIVQRFFNEAKATTAIEHPAIVDIFDFGYADDGGAYIVMELLTGQSLGDRLRQRGRLTMIEAVSLTRQVAHGLGAAHAQGIIHRDLKPDNVHIERDPAVPGGERAKILDFGIAKLAGDQHPDAIQTRAGAIMGSPAYMAPEQAAGAGNVDHRADIYALGCVLFEMLCGRTPFVGDGYGQILAAHQHMQPPKLRLLVPEAPPAMESIVDRMLQKHPDARFQSMDEVISALDFVVRSVHPSQSLPALDPTGAPPRGATPSGGTPYPPMPTVPSSSGRGKLLAILLFFLIAMSVAGVGVYLAVNKQRAQTGEGGGDAGTARPAGPCQTAEACGKACYDGQVASCVRTAALMLAPPGGGERDMVAAAPYYDKACEGGVGASCQALARALDVGDGVKRDLKRAASLFEKACELGEPAGCEAAGMAHLTGRGVAQDEPRAGELLRKALSGYRTRCEGTGDEGEPLARAHACRRLGSAYATGKRGVLRDEAQSQAFYRKAREGYRAICDGAAPGGEDGGEPGGGGDGAGGDGDASGARAVGPEACAALAEMIVRGEGAERIMAQPDSEVRADDIAAAAKLYAKACEADLADACARLGDLQLRGDSPDEDAARTTYQEALALRRAACDRAEHEGCAALAGMLAQGRGATADEEAARKLWTEVCEARPDLGCGPLADMLWRGVGGQPDRTEAVAKYQQACTAGAEAVCLQIANIYAEGESIRRDEDAAAAILRAACDGGGQAACVRLGELRETGGRDVRDRDKAREYYQRACIADEGEGCRRLGKLYYDGVGVDRDRARALELYEEGCSYGAPASCLDAGDLHDRGGGGVDRDQEAATRAYDRGCRARGGEACYELSKRYRAGKGVDRDRDQASALERVACGLGYRRACK